MKVAIDNGLVETTVGGYQFSHDKLQASFESMLNDVEKKQLHLSIAETFQTFGDTESFYNAANHFNQASVGLKNYAERIEGARMNLEAAKYCIDKSAFIDASTFLRHGLDFLDSLNDKWSRHFNLAFDITELLARIELVLGNLEASKKLTSEALQRAKSVGMKINLLVLDVEGRMAANEMRGGVVAANRGLTLLGIKKPSKIAFRHLLFKIFKIKNLLRNKTDQDILSLPKMTNRVKATAVKLLLHVCYCGLSTDDEIQATHAALLALELTLKGGISPHSAHALAIYGIAELAMGNYEKGYRFGKLALNLQDQLNSKETESGTIASSVAMLSHWRDELCTILTPMERAMDSGFETGDLLSGIFCFATYLTAANLIGTNLKVLAQFASVHFRRMCDLCIDKDDPRTFWPQPSMQYIQNLQTQDPKQFSDLTVLTGEFMNEDEYTRHARGSNHMLLLMSAWSYKVELAYSFGMYSLAELILEDMATVGQAARHHFSITRIYFLGSITQLYRMYGVRKHLKTARTYHKSLDRLRHCPNSIPLLTFLRAECLSVRRQVNKEGSFLTNPATIETCVAAYVETIAEMKRAKWVHLEALANERVGFYLQLVRDAVRAERYFKSALRLYKDEWGATAKYNWLLQESGLVLNNERLPCTIILEGEEEGE